MVELNECVALEVNGEEVSLSDVLKLAKLYETLKFYRRRHHRNLDSTRRATTRNRGLMNEELQQAADNYRAQHELHNAETTESWLKIRKLSYEDWESLLEFQVKEGKLREALTAGSVEQRFAEQRLLFDKAAISRTRASMMKASRARAAGTNHRRRHRFSCPRAVSILFIVDTRPAGGYAGLMMRTIWSRRLKRQFSVLSLARLLVQSRLTMVGSWSG
jgi:hypothetical protein